MDILLITEQNLKNLTPISDNCKLGNPLVQAIFSAQRKYIRNLLGRKLYDEIQTQLSTNTLTPENTTLIEELQNYLAWIVFYEYLPNNFIRTREVGPTNLTGQNTTVIDLRLLTYIRGEAKKSAEEFKNQFVCWMLETTNSYPLWCYKKDKGSLDDFCMYI